MQVQEHLKMLSEQLALNDHISLYQWRADHFQWNDWVELFTEDAVFEELPSGRTARGREQILDVFRPPVEQVFDRTQHLIANLRFEITEPHAATGYGNLIIIGAPKVRNPTGNFVAGGFYQWKFIKSDRWRTAFTRLEFIWSGAAPFFEGSFGE